MAEKQPPPPSSPGSVKGKAPKPGLTDIIDDNAARLNRVLKVLPTAPRAIKATICKESTEHKVMERMGLKVMVLKDHEEEILIGTMN
uniref:Uncharacterized protein n=1 Tax=Oryza sativa subsp. japonica TaxID=39947 RepID=Q6YUD0_ORYSJ|nr:hypothetical protein [Oryza sativa Japonica Group]